MEGRNWATSFLNLLSLGTFQGEGMVQIRIFVLCGFGKCAIQRAQCDSVEDPENKF